MATNDRRHDPTDAIEQLFDDLSVYRDIGLDSEGRSHFYDADADQIVVCEGDQRGRGISDDDIDQRINVPAGSTGAWDYIQFVREEVDGVEWAETDVPEVAPDA
jgi:hypothetical protein